MVAIKQKAKRMALETITEEITPEVAERYLSTSNGNRNTRKIWVDQLADMMTANEFYHTHQGIAFNCDGSLRDGHHRLMAIIKSGTTQKMQVTFGVSSDAMIAVDSGRNRDLSDRSSFSGDKLTRPEIAVVRAWLSLLGELNPSDARILAFAKENMNHISFATHETYGVSGIYRHACITCMLAVASKAGKEDMLEGWFESFKSGVASEPWQTSAVALREWWLRNNRHGGKSARIAMCHRIYGSMKAWSERRGLQKSYELSIIDWID